MDSVTQGKHSGMIKVQEKKGDILKEKKKKTKKKTKISTDKIN